MEKFLQAEDESGAIWTVEENGTIQVQQQGLKPDFAIGDKGKTWLTQKKRLPMGSNITHGSTSEVILSTRSADVAEALITQCPWVLEIDRITIEHYCRSEARARLLDEYVWQVVDEDGVAAVPVHIWEALSKAEVNAMRAATSLGLNPEGRLRIAKDAGMATYFQGSVVANNVKTLIEKGRSLRTIQGGAHHE
ncbi:MAG: hypothetical protein QXL94_00610 [Candidatus Parvarchaeum sp.]